MTLGTLRSLFYAYLGTTPSDPMYPKETVTALVNAVASKYRHEIAQLNPGWLAAPPVTIHPIPGSRTYALPLDFAGWLDVRLADERGTKLTEVRLDELNAAACQDAFCVTGPDSNPTIQLSRGTPDGSDLYLLYRQRPALLAQDTDEPRWMPEEFHDLLAREAAIDAFGVGAESAPSPTFLDETRDRRALLWLYVSRRGVQPMQTR